MESSHANMKNSQYGIVDTRIQRGLMCAVIICEDSDCICKQPLPTSLSLSFNIFMDSHWSSALYFLKINDIGDPVCPQNSFLTSTACLSYLQVLGYSYAGVMRRYLVEVRMQCMVLSSDSMLEASFIFSLDVRHNKQCLSKSTVLKAGCVLPSSLQYSIICSDGVDLTHLNEFSSCDSNSSLFDCCQQFRRF